MFFNFGNYLKYLTLEVKFNKFKKFKEVISQIVLKELSKSLLSLSLHYLDLYLQINPDHLQAFFENFCQVRIKKVLSRGPAKIGTILLCKIGVNF